MGTDCKLYISECRKWFKTWGTWPVHSWILAASAFRRGHYRLARKCYLRGIERHPEHRAKKYAILDCGTCAWHLGDIEQAIELLTRLSEPEQSLKEGSLLCAWLQESAGDLQGAENTLQQAIENFPDDISVLSASLHLQIRLYADRSSVQGLRDRLLSLVSGKVPSESDVAEGQGALAHFTARYIDSYRGERALSALLALNRGSLNVVMAYADLMFEKRNFVAARELYRRAVSVSPLDPRPLMKLAQVHLAIGRKRDLMNALVLAKSAADLSKYRNLECLETLKNAYIYCGDTLNSELIGERIQEQVSEQQLNLSNLELATEKLQSLANMLRA